jgi:hypothetical protein
MPLDDERPRREPGLLRRQLQLPSTDELVPPLPPEELNALDAPLHDRPVLLQHGCYAQAHRDAFNRLLAAPRTPAFRPIALVAPHSAPAAEDQLSWVLSLCGRGESIE